MDPRRILISRRLIEIIDQVARQNISSLVADHDRTPGSGERKPYLSLIAVAVRREPRGEYHRRIIKIQMHRRIVNQCRLMEIDIKPIVTLEHQRSLHARRRKRRLRDIAQLIIGIIAADLAQSRLDILIFLSVIIPGNPPRRHIARHRKLRRLISDRQLLAVASGENIAETYAIVISPELDIHLKRIAINLLHQLHSHGIVIIVDNLILTPHRRPLATCLRSINARDTEIISSIESLEHQAQSRFLDHRQRTIVNAIDRTAARNYVECQRHLARRRAKYLRRSPCRSGYSQHCQPHRNLFDHHFKWY